MTLDFSAGKIVITAHEVLVRLYGDHRVTLQASIDDLQLIGRGANVLSANVGGTQWSIKLDTEEQITEISTQCGLEIL